MKRLINIEFKKLFYYKRTKIMFALFFGGLILALLGLPHMGFTVNGSSIKLKDLKVFSFPHIWNNVGYMASFGKFFLAIIFISNIINEFQFGTYKQNIIDGLSRKEFYWTKFINAISLAFFTSFLVSIMIVIIGLINGDNTNLFQGSQYAFLLFLDYFLFLMVCLFLSVLFKNIVFSFLGIFALNFLEGILKIFRMMIFKNSSFTINQTDYYFDDFLPLTINSHLIRFPQSNISNLMSDTSMFSLNKVQGIEVCMALAYGALFGYLSYILLQKRDIK